jgi:hypothetical protein
LSTSDNSGRAISREHACCSDGEAAERASEDDDEDDAVKSSPSSDDMLGSSTSASVDSFEIAALTLDAHKYLADSSTNAVDDDEPVAAATSKIQLGTLETLVEAEDEGCGHGTLTSTTDTAIGDGVSTSVSPSLTVATISQTDGDSGRVGVRVHASFALVCRRRTRPRVYDQNKE